MIRKEHPRYHIVSVRVTTLERELLEKMSRKANKSVSDLMREALRTMAPRQISG